MTGFPTQRLRVLFLCTGNSARSQMAEAVMNRKGAGRFDAQSAGSHPAVQVNPLAIAALREAGIEWRGHSPRRVDGPEEIQRAAFADALRLIGRRIDLMLALPIEKLDHLAPEARVRAIGQVGAEAVA
jgi:arsenate reductase